MLDFIIMAPIYYALHHQKVDKSIIKQNLKKKRFL